MKRRAFLAASGLAALILALPACGSTDRMRYRMTVEVDTPQGLRTGSAVREITHSVPPPYPSVGESRPQWRVRGEAVAIDLPGNQTLFALLRSEEDGDFGGWGVWWLFRQQQPARSIELWPKVPVTGKPIVADPVPMLVRFRDIADPKTVEQVDPDDLAKSFGPGVRLRRITVQLTDEPVTKGIEKRLGWLGKYPEPSLDPSHSPTDFSPSATIHHGDFRRGEFK